MTPELPPPAAEEGRPDWQPGRAAPFGPEARASVERSLLKLQDPDDALRVLALVQENGAGFAAYLMLPDTNLADPEIAHRFHDVYMDAWERFEQFRNDFLQWLGRTEALNDFLRQQAIPADNLIWNYAPLDRQILSTYDAVYLDGWWHIFAK